VGVEGLAPRLSKYCWVFRIVLGLLYGTCHMGAAA
jgi:membrane-associated PAP2 superfamily phosphatase